MIHFESGLQSRSMHGAQSVCAWHVQHVRLPSKGHLGNSEGFECQQLYTTSTEYSQSPTYSFIKHEVPDNQLGSISVK